MEMFIPASIAKNIEPETEICFACYHYDYRLGYLRHIVRWYQPPTIMVQSAIR